MIHVACDVGAGVAQAIAQAHQRDPVRKGQIFSGETRFGSRHHQIGQPLQQAPDGALRVIGLGAVERLRHYLHIQ